MLPRTPQPLRHTCACGSKLRWESRQTWRGKRWFAFCVSDQCGRWTTQIADGPERPEGLAEFLLDEQPARPYVPAWRRFFLFSANRGLPWRPAPGRCSACAEELVMQLDLPYDPSRTADPRRVVLCLHCGNTELSMWALGDLGELRLEGDAWNQPAVAILALKRAVADHTRSEPDDSDDGTTWHFGS